MARSQLADATQPLHRRRVDQRSLETVQIDVVVNGVRDRLLRTQPLFLDTPRPGLLLQLRQAPLRHGYLPWYDCALYGCKAVAVSGSANPHSGQAPVRKGPVVRP